MICDREYCFSYVLDPVKLRKRWQGLEFHLVALFHMSLVSHLSFEVHRPELSIVFKMLVHLYLVRIGDVLSNYCFVS